MKILNYTPHELVMYSDDFEVLETIKSSGFARANQENELIGEINKYPISKIKYGSVENFPDPQANTVFVVSQITATALKEQGRTDDILIVDKAVRLDNDGKLNIKVGKIVGCMGFAQV